MYIIRLEISLEDNHSRRYLCNSYLKLIGTGLHLIQVLIQQYKNYTGLFYNDKRI